MRSFFAFLLTLALTLMAVGAEGQEPPSSGEAGGADPSSLVVAARVAAGHTAGSGDWAPDPVALRLARALEKRLTVWRTPTGGVVHVSHCRGVREGCRARIAAFARWMAELSRANGVDPFVVAAIAVRESGLDPFAQGAAGEMGIVQLHPRGIGRRVRFVQSEAYRRRCSRDPGACQREVLDVGVRHLAQAVEHCGSIEAGLGAYNTGECRENAYSARVMRERARLLELAKDRDEQPVNVD